MWQASLQRVTLDSNTHFCFHQAKVTFPSNLKPNTSVQNLAVKLQPDYFNSSAPERQRNYGGWQGTKWMLPWLLLLHFSVLSISNHSLCFHLAHSYNLWDKNSISINDKNLHALICLAEMFSMCSFRLLWDNMVSLMQNFNEPPFLKKIANSGLSYF